MLVQVSWMDMIKRYPVRWPVIVISLLAGGILGAQSPLGMLISEQSRTGFTVQGAGGRAMGLGGAFIAVADDASAVSFNPAGLAQLMLPEVSVVGQGVNRRVSYRDFESTSSRGSATVSDSLIGNSRFDPLALSGSIPLLIGDKNLCIQFSAQRAFTLGEGDSRDLLVTPNADSGANTNLRQSIDQSGQIDVYSFAMAYEVSQRILIGASYNLWRGRWDLNSNSANSTGDVENYMAFHQDNRFSGQNYNLGLIWRWPTWSLGVVYHTAFRAEYGFRMGMESNLKSLNTRGDGDGGLHWPAVLGVGLAVRPWERVLITADLVLTPWSTARFTTGSRNLNGLNFFSSDRGGATPNATVFRMGSEYVMVRDSGDIIPFRAGVCREPQPVQDVLTGEQRVMYGVTLGSGYKKGMHSVDLAYRYSWSRRRASQFMDVEQLAGKDRTTNVGEERTIENRLNLSYTVQFRREPVQKAFHYLFVGD